MGVISVSMSTQPRSPRASVPFGVNCVRVGSMARVFLLNETQFLNPSTRAYCITREKNSGKELKVAKTALKAARAP